MRKPWQRLVKATKVEVVTPEGEIRSTSTAYFTGEVVIIDDMKVDIRVGDELRRQMPNGNDEAWRVDDPKLFETSVLAPHYQVKVSRPQIHPHHQGGNFNITVSGANARVNINSQDSSTNTVQTNPVFNQARDILANLAVDASQKTAIKAEIDGMEAARTQGTFKEAYDGFMGSASDHMTVFAPILPALMSAVMTLPA